ncbi:2-phospho-L-lactate transferase CofD family protein, partial [Micromonospora phytophila]
MTATKVVAFGGGHGLSASLRALRRCAPEIDLDITAVVTVGDDGGSSGR